MQRSVAATEQDWSLAPDYSFTDRDVSSKRGQPQPTKTHRVLMINGSPYNELVAVNDAPLSAEEQAREQEKLKRVIAKRSPESAAARQRRVAGYLRQRKQDHAMLSEMIQAFHYTLTGEDTVNGRKVWVLAATPKPGYVPHNREGRMLQHMRGNLWVDQATYQWVKVQAQVVAPVSMYGFLAQIKPGTQFELEQWPLTSGLWLPKRFVVTVKATALGIRNENSRDEDDYSDYRLESPAE